VALIANDPVVLEYNRTPIVDAEVGPFDVRWDDDVISQHLGINEG
jgi:hypothetical protein